MKNINNESKHIYGGRSYHCPFGCNKSGGYLSVYVHCLKKECYKRNHTLNGIHTAYKICSALRKIINLTK